MSVGEDLFVKRLLEMHDRLFNFAFKFTSDRDCALDLLQDTILKALYNRDKYIENTNIAGWAFTIMKNIFINDYLKVKRFRSLVDSTNDFTSLNLLNSSESYNPDYTFTIKEINNVIASFPEEYQIPFEMHIYPDGKHGTSLCNDIVGKYYPAVNDWTRDCVRWMNMIAVEKKTK